MNVEILHSMSVQHRYGVVAEEREEAGAEKVGFHIGCCGSRATRHEREEEVWDSLEFTNTIPKASIRRRAAIC